MRAKFILLPVIVLMLASHALATTEIVLWYSYRGLEHEALKTEIEKFNRTESTIDVKLLQVPHDAFPDKITAAIPRGRGPDLFIFAQDRIGDWAESDIIQPVGFFATRELRERFLPQTLDAVTYAEDLYALPMAVKCTALYYNRELLPTPPESSSELIAHGARLTDQEKGIFGLVYENGLFYYQAAWLQGFGGEILTEDNKPALDSPANIRGLEFAVALRRRHAIMPEEISNTVVTSLFNEGKVAMVISGPWFRAEIAEKIDFGVAVLPRIDEQGLDGAAGRPFLSVEGLMLSSATDHPKEAFAVMDYLTSKSSAITRARLGKQPVATSSAYDDPMVASDTTTATFRRQAETAVPMPNVPEMRMVWTPMDRAIGKVLNGTATAAEALGQAQKEVSADLDRFHGK